jgi:hypothetical protein
MSSTGSKAKKDSAGNEAKEIGYYVNWDQFNISDEWKEKVEEFFEDLTTLTITTVGSGNEEIVTKIKLQGDITSKTTLTGEKLVAYHERMTDTSVKLIKNYAQIAIATISIFLPWAGLKLDSDALKTLKEVFSQISLGKQS